MQVDDAQREMRDVFMGGFPGQMVSGVLWISSAAMSTWVSTRAGVLVLTLGGMCIFPCTLLLLKAMGRPGSLSRANPLGQLAMQVAFTIPLNLPLVGAAAIHRLDWFYPACMIVVGSHYVPFAFLYGMPAFFVLGLALVFCGLLLGLYVPGPFATGGWVTGGVLLVFAVVARSMAAHRSLAQV